MSYRIECSCGGTHNGKTAARIMKRCGGRELRTSEGIPVDRLSPAARESLARPNVAAPGGLPMMLRASLPSTQGRAFNTRGPVLRDLAAERVLQQRAEAIGGTI